MESNRCGRVLVARRTWLSTGGSDTGVGTLVEGELDGEREGEEDGQCDPQAGSESDALQEVGNAGFDRAATLSEANASLVCGALLTLRRIGASFVESTPRTVAPACAFRTAESRAALFLLRLLKFRPLLARPFVCFSVPMSGQPFTDRFFVGFHCFHFEPVLRIPRTGVRRCRTSAPRNGRPVEPAREEVEEGDLEGGFVVH